MHQFYRDPVKIATFLKEWLTDAVSGANAKGAVFGLSGGVDSSALAAMLRVIYSREEMLAVIMPCHSQPVDEECAMLVARTLDIPTKKIDLTAAYDSCVAAIEGAVGQLSDIAKANIKPRLRMTTLYAIARERNFLVCGGANKDELAFGYFTKHGDSGVDLMPFGELLKGEVFSLAEYLGVPREIIERAPSAGLWEGQTDEGEMGVTYADLDRYIAAGEGNPEICEKIAGAFSASAHKRAMAPIAPIPRQETA